MTNWTEGYNANVAYVDHVYHELSPDYLTLVCLLNGVRPPRVDRPFRYCELGCGMGTGLAVAAAVHAGSRFVGVDFDPQHVAHARRLADVAGLDNVEFREESFRDLADRLERQPLSDGERFDFVVMHGVFTWVSQENRNAIATFLKHAVRPGGLVYISYNSRAGWAPLVPLQRALLRHVAVNNRHGDDRLDAALAFLDDLKEAGAGYFGINPASVQHLVGMLKQNRSYLAHEYLNEHWDVLDHADVAETIGPAKLTFVGSATIPFNYDDLCYSPAVRERLAGIEDRALAEMVRDFATNRGFRRDLFVRGAERLSPEATLEALRPLRFTLRRPRDEAHLIFPIPLGELRTEEASGVPVLDALAAGNPTFAELESRLTQAGQPTGGLARCLALIVSSGQGDLVNEQAAVSAAGSLRLNREICRRILLGEDLTAVAAPLVGGNIGLDSIESLALAGLFAGCPETKDGIAAFTVDALRRKGATMAGENGEPLNDPQELLARATTIADVLLQRRIPLWRQLGVL